jgi:hypothetical protein
MDKIAFLDISFQSANLFSFMLGMFIGAMMFRIRAMTYVAIYFAILAIYYSLIKG